MGGRRRRHVAGKQRDIRILAADLLHLPEHAQAVAVGRVNIDYVNLGGQQRVNPLKHVVRDAHRGAAQQPAVRVLGAVGILARLFNILDRDQAAEVSVLIHDREFLNPVAGQDLLGLLQGGAFRRGDQVFTGHDLADGAAVICFKPEIPVGQDADQFPFPGDWHAADRRSGSPG